MNSAKRPRILLINTYSMEYVNEMFKMGTFPGHHLFGAPELTRDHGFEVIIPKQVRYPWINKVGNIIGIEFIEQQLRALLMIRRYDLLYAPFAAMNTKLIILLKVLGLVKVPVVILVHHALFGPPSKNKLKRRLVKKLIMNYDGIVFFGDKMMHDLIAAYDIDPKHVSSCFRSASWGVDLDFFEKYDEIVPVENQNFVISSGNTGRDFDILLKAATRVDFPFKIYCRPESYPTIRPIPPNVELLSGEFPFDQICRDYQKARIALIPLQKGFSGPVGLTSLLEAMAFGKPVIITKNEFIEVDYSKDLIGQEVQLDHVEEWVTAINNMISNAPMLEMMSFNSKQLAYRKFNIRGFGNLLAEFFNTLLDRHKA